MTSESGQGGGSGTGAPAPTHRQSPDTVQAPDTVPAPDPSSSAGPSGGSEVGGDGDAAGAAEAGEPGGAPGASGGADAAGFAEITWADETSAEPTRSLDEPVEAAPGEDISFGEGAIDEALNRTTDPGDAAGPADSTGPADPADPADPGDPAGRAPGGTGEATAGGEPPTEISVEDLVQDLERVAAERDRYLDTSRRLQAELENYRKQVAKREAEARERANEHLVVEILPVLDACDGALASGATDVEPVRTALIDALVRQGLDRIDDAESPFDPARHDAVMHEPDEGGDGPVVAEVMRAGYSWKGRVVRPAMVRVRG